MKNKKILYTEKSRFSLGKNKLVILSLTLLLAVFSVFTNTNPLYAQWVSTGGPGPGASVRSFAVNSSYFFTGTWGGPNGYYGGAFRTTNNGTNWIAINSGLTDTVVLALAVSGTNLYAGTYSGVFRSTNDGTNWVSVNNGLTNLSVYSLIVNGTNLFAGTGDGVFRSANNGTNWAFTGLTGNFIFAFEVIGPNLFAGAYGDGVFRSSNNGANWTQINTGLTNTAIQCLAASGSDLYAGTFSGVFRSTNNGANWINTLGLAGSIINALAVSSGNVFAGSSGGGIFLTTNNGNNWLSVGTGMPNTTINTLAITGTNIFAGTLSGNVYKRPLSEMITSVKLLSTDLPADFNLSQNFPNPFNPVSTIKYQLPKESYVTIKLYNILGKEAGILFEGSQQAGYYQAEVDGTNLASGIYFCRINTADYSKVIKMSLIK